MSYKLDKPYTDEQYVDFIVEYNYNQGLEIQEGDVALYALQPWEILQGDEVIDNSEQYQQELIDKRQKDFNNNFVITSWGAFRKTPKGYSSAVEAVNTIFNMVNVQQAFTAQLAPLLIFYEVPDFTNPDECTEEWLVANQKTHEPCNLATFMQWYLEFQSIWASTQYTDIPVPQMENVEENLEL